MPLQKDFTLLVTDEEFRALVLEALRSREVLKYDSKVVVASVSWIRSSNRWKIDCEKPSAPKDGGQ